jgi:hypothetical protein
MGEFFLVLGCFFFFGGRRAVVAGGGGGARPPLFFLTFWLWRSLPAFWYRLVSRERRARERGTRCRVPCFFLSSLAPPAHPLPALLPTPKPPQNHSRLTDSKGRTVDFKNTLIIMTSNVGASVIEKGGRSFGFFLRPDDEDAEQDLSYGRIKSLVNEELKAYFRPEFLNRLDEIIVFRQLTKKEVKQIADIMLADVFKRALERGLTIEVTEKFKEKLVDEGFNPTYGARPLRRAIMRLIEDCLAERILGGDIKEGDTVIMDVDPDGTITVLAGDRKMRQVLDATPAGIA